MSISFLLTGVTGGLGAKVLHDMLHIHSIPPSDIVATSRSESNREHYEAQGLQFRVADYNDPKTLLNAFQNVNNLLFMSSSERDTTTRNHEHGNVVAAAKQAGVKKVWYVSLAFGGYDDTSTIGFQLAHYETENILLASGLDFVSLRAGVYADAFPLFLNWYPSSNAVLMPNVDPPVSEGKISFASRDELGEAIATILVRDQRGTPTTQFPTIRPRGKKNILLLTGPVAESLPDLVGAINRGRGTEIPIEYLEPEEWIEASAKDDVGGKSRGWFESRLHFTQRVCAGDAVVVDPTLEVVLGRRPETGTQAVERLVRADPEYTWHQNHMR